MITCVCVCMRACMCVCVCVCVCVRVCVWNSRKLARGILLIFEGVWDHIILFLTESHTLQAKLETSRCCGLIFVRLGLQSIILLECEARHIVSKPYKTFFSIYPVYLIYLGLCLETTLLELLLFSSTLLSGQLLFSSTLLYGQLLFLPTLMMLARILLSSTLMLEWMLCGQILMLLGMSHLQMLRLAWMQYLDAPIWMDMPVPIHHHGYLHDETKFTKKE